MPSNTPSTPNIPNLLTWLRIWLIPVFIAVYYLPPGWLHPQWVNLSATAIFGVAAATDWLDGYLARALNQASAFGAFLDPVAANRKAVRLVANLLDQVQAGVIFRQL